MRLATLLLLVTILIIPPSMAQVPNQSTVETTTTVRVFDPGDPLPPGRTSVLVVAVRYQYGQGAQADEPTEVTLEVTDVPPWADAELRNTTLSYPVPATSATSGRTDERRVELNLTLDPGAPAFQPGDVTVRAEAEENGNLAASEDQDTQPVEPDFDARLTATAPESLVVAGGRDHGLTLTVENSANAPTRVIPRVQAQPENSLVTLPAPFNLGDGSSNGTLPASSTTTVHLRTPWTSGEEGTLTLELQPVHADRDDALGRVRTVSVEIQGQSVVPAPHMTLLLALGLGAVARGRLQPPR